MAVLDIVERGISRSRAKTLYELVDSQFYLTYLDFREGILEKDIIKRRSLGMQIEKHILLKWNCLGFISQLEEVLYIFTVINAQSSFEEMVLQRVYKLKLMCQKLISVADKECDGSNNES